MLESVYCWFVIRHFHRSTDALSSTVNRLAIAGLGLGIGALLFLSALIQSVEHVICERTVGQLPYAWISSTQRSMTLDGPPPLPDSIPQDAVTGMQPLVMGEVLIKTHHAWSMGQMLGLFPGESEPLLAAAIPDPPLAGGKLSPQSVLVGAELAQQLSIQLDDWISLFTPHSIHADEGATPGLFKVVGFIRSQSYADKRTLLLNVDDAREMLAYPPDRITGWRVTLQDPMHIPVGAAFNPAHAHLTWNDWREEHSTLAYAMNLIGIAMPLLYGIFTAICFFNLFNAQGLQVFSRTRDIAVLRTLGCSRHRMLMLFLFQGIVMVTLGVALGLSLGVLMVRYSQLIFKLVHMPDTPTGPLLLTLNPTQVFHRMGIPVLLSSLGMLYPARKAGTLDPVKALQYE